MALGSIGWLTRSYLKIIVEALTTMPFHDIM
jgi:hypothetical protein